MLNVFFFIPFNAFYVLDTTGFVQRISLNLFLIFILDFSQKQNKNRPVVNFKNMKKTKTEYPSKKKTDEPQKIREMKKAATKIARSYVPSKGNSSWLIIVESPSKCKKIEEYLGSDYRCIATMGHLQYIEGLNAIEQTDGSFHIQYSTLPEKVEHVEQMRRIINLYPPNRVLIATDDDREGEAIAWHILYLFHLPPDTPRITFHEITRPALLHAVQHPTVVNQSLVQSQQARQVIDLLIGFKISPLLWKYVFRSHQDALSAGRCQSTALRLVYENDCGTAFNTPLPPSQWKTVAYFTSENIPFQYSRHLPETDLLHLYRAVCENPEFSFSIVAPKTRTVSPPKPFTTARLLQHYTSYSPSKVMSLCQVLYQEGYITYMRTDTENYSPVFLQQAREYCEATQLEFGYKTTGSVVEGPHEAIRVTHLETTCYTGMDSDQNTLEKHGALNALYQFIWRNTLASCMTPAIFHDVAILATQAAVEGHFSTTIEIPVKYGWKALGKKQEEMTEEVGKQQATLLFFRSLSQPTLWCHRLESPCFIERPPKHYSEASLIAQLEKRGIGRPSTFAYLVDVLVQRGYVKITDVEGTQTPCCDYSLDLMAKQKEPVKTCRDVWVGKEHNRLVIQALGVITMEFLLNYFDGLFSYDYTHQMERELDLVAEGKKTKQAVCLNCRQNITEALEPLKTVEKRKIPKLDKGKYEFILQKFGNALKEVLDDGTVEYHPVKNIKIDMTRLQSGGYTSTDLLEFPNRSNYLGKYRGEDVCIKKGPYGWYIRYSGSGSQQAVKKSGDSEEEDDDDKNHPESVSVGSLPIPKGVDIHNIQLQDVISWIQEKENPSVGNPHLVNKSEGERSPPKLGSSQRYVLRTLNNHCSVRTGKYGPYLMITEENPAVGTKKKSKSAVQFHSLKKFTGDFLTCSIEDLLAFSKQGAK